MYTLYFCTPPPPPPIYAFSSWGQIYKNVLRHAISDRALLNTHFTSHVSSLNFEPLPWQQNYKRYLAEFGSIEKWNFWIIQSFKKILSWNLAWRLIFGPLSSKSNIKLEYDIMVMFLPFYCLGLFTDQNTNMTSLWCQTSNFPNSILSIIN